MTKKQVLKKLEDGELDGYITGMDRSVDWTESLVAHIYRGEFDAPTEGLCAYSMDEDGYFSIFRNNIGRKGVCRICLKKLMKEINGKA